MGESRNRRLLWVGLFLLLCTSWTLAGCTSGSGGKAQTANRPDAGRGASESAAYVPLSEAGEELPPWAATPGGAGAGRTAGGSPPADPRSQPAWQPEREVAPPPREAPRIPCGPQYRVTWEALAVEQRAVRQSPLRPPEPAGCPEHPEGGARQREPPRRPGASKAGRCVSQSQGVAVATISDRGHGCLPPRDRAARLLPARPAHRLHAGPLRGLERPRPDHRSSGPDRADSLVSMRGQGLEPRDQGDPRHVLRGEAGGHAAQKPGAADVVGSRATRCAVSPVAASPGAPGPAPGPADGDAEGDGPPTPS